MPSRSVMPRQQNQVSAAELGFSDYKSPRWYILRRCQTILSSQVERTNKTRSRTFLRAGFFMASRSKNVDWKIAQRPEHWWGNRLTSADNNSRVVISGGIVVDGDGGIKWGTAAPRTGTRLGLRNAVRTCKNSVSVAWPPSVRIVFYVCFLCARMTQKWCMMAEAMTHGDGCNDAWRISDDEWCIMVNDAFILRLMQIYTMDDAVVMGMVQLYLTSDEIMQWW